MQVRHLLLAAFLAVVAVVAPACAGDEPAEVVTVVGTEMAFTPHDVAVPHGDLEIRFRNDGAVIHEIAVEQGGRAVERVYAGPGQSAVLDLDLDPGAYELTCREPGHYQGGMRGTLTVGGG